MRAVADNAVRHIADSAASVVPRCKSASQYRALGGCRQCVALQSPFMSVSSSLQQLKTQQCCSLPEVPSHLLKYFRHTCFEWNVQHMMATSWLVCSADAGVADSLQDVCTQFRGGAYGIRCVRPMTTNRKATACCEFATECCWVLNITMLHHQRLVYRHSLV